MEQQEAAKVETQSPRRIDGILVLAGTVVVLGGFLYWTGMTLGLYQGSSLLHEASAKIAGKLETTPAPAPAPEKPEGPSIESRLAAIKAAVAPIPVPATRQLLAPDPFRAAGRPIMPPLFAPVKPLDAAARKAMEDRSLVSKTALPDGRTHLSITMNPTALAPVKPAPKAKNAAPSKSKPAASGLSAWSVQTVAIAGYDLNRRESDLWVTSLAMVLGR